MKLKIMSFILFFIACMLSSVNVFAEENDLFFLEIKTPGRVHIDSSQAIMVSVKNGDPDEIYTYEWICSEGNFENIYVNNDTVWIKPDIDSVYSETAMWKYDGVWDNKDFEVCVSVKVTDSKGESRTARTVFTVGHVLGGAETLYEHKPNYPEETVILYEDGLLNGDERGLEPRRAVTRAEAVALVVRAAGFEQELNNYAESVFLDVPVDSWVSPYAALAKDKEIVMGIDDNEFEPNKPISVNQFASLMLRALGERDFDYTQGVQLLISRGIVTAEQVEQMDPFTRGDMAKIIYEARQKGVLKAYCR